MRKEDEVREAIIDRNCCCPELSALLSRHKHIHAQSLIHANDMEALQELPLELSYSVRAHSRALVGREARKSGHIENCFSLRGHWSNWRKKKRKMNVKSIHSLFTLFDLRSLELKTVAPKRNTPLEAMPIISFGIEADHNFASVENS